MTLQLLGIEKHLGGQHHDPRVDLLIARLPPRLSAAVRWRRQSSSAWIRRAAAILLICGGLLSFLPILGLWMLPAWPLVACGRCAAAQIRSNSHSGLDRTPTPKLARS